MFYILVRSFNNLISGNFVFWLRDQCFHKADKRRCSKFSKKSLMKTKSRFVIPMFQLTPLRSRFFHQESGESVFENIWRTFVKQAERGGNRRSAF